MSDELDKLFGELKEPARTVTDVEKKCKPISIIVLGKKSAPILKDHMVAARSHNLGKTLHNFVKFLWLIRENGDLAISIEETVHPVDHYTTGVFVGQTDKRNLKLGHPALTNDDDFRGRIGGELLYDEKWIITNSSGGYGRKTATKRHLTNVAKEFKKYDIKVTPSYLGSPGQ